MLMVFCGGNGVYVDILGVLLPVQVIVTSLMHFIVCILSSNMVCKTKLWFTDGVLQMEFSSFHWI